MALRGSVSSSLAQTGSFGRMQGHRISTKFLNVQSGSFGRVVATNFAGDGSQLTNVPVDLPAEIISSKKYGELAKVGDINSIADSIKKVISNDYNKNDLIERSNFFSVDNISNMYIDLLNNENKKS